MEEGVGDSMPASAPASETQPERYYSESADRSCLAEPLPFAFSGRTAPNRLMKAAMTEQLCTFDIQHPESNGIPTENIERCYERWGRGGIGLILSGNVSMSCRKQLPCKPDCDWEFWQLQVTG